MTRLFLQLRSIAALATLNSALLSHLPVAESQEAASTQTAPDANQLLQAIRLPEGWQGEVVATEPNVINPVTFCFDEQGRLYVAETFRQSKGVEDNRSHQEWLLDDLAARTVADRLAYFKKHLGDRLSTYAREEDRIRRLTDTNGDGRYDQAEIFADGFRNVLDGTGAGLLAWNGSVYFTCIPHLWRLVDQDDDGKADIRESLHEGYGVRVAFRGHDSHGLVMGPDGRIYFSIGDRGANLQTKEQRTIAIPDQGIVFRCEPDGSQLEVFATGLRNPQELAFDDFGNLFTGDNNSDSGDRARWVYVVEGGDSGWRMYYQYLSDRGPWNREKLWHPAHPGQAAYLLPPILNIADGPSGLAYYPGVGLPEKYRGHFFLADFRGQSGNSGIRSFKMQPKGASFELIDAEEPIWSVLATDVGFGYDGWLYALDWVDGWEGPGKGRVYRFRDPAVSNDAGNEVAELMRNGFEELSEEELRKLLAHPDYRVRQRAQFTFVEANAPEQLLEVASQHESLYARVHAIWGLGQLMRKSPHQIFPVVLLSDDPEPEIRAQLARILGDAKNPAYEKTLVKLLLDDDLRVRSLAAISLGKNGTAACLKPLLKVLEENNNQDPVLRFAAANGLAGSQAPDALLEAAKSAGPAVRLGIVVALRRQKSPTLASFLQDPEPAIVTEAVRAIHDLPLPTAYPALADLAGQPALEPETIRRVMNACFRLGEPRDADAVAAMAASASIPENLRLEAIEELRMWNAPPLLDRVLNDYRPLAKRQVDLVPYIRPRIAALFNGSPAIREGAVKLAAAYGIQDVEPYLVSLVNDAQQPSRQRVAALSALASLNSQKLKELATAAVETQDPALRTTGRRILCQLDPESAAKLLRPAMEAQSVAEQQGAIEILADLNSPETDAVLADWLDALLAGKTQSEITLDLLNAAKKRQTAPLLERVAEFDQLRPLGDPLARYREALAGGDAARGQQIFFAKAEVSCLRCHKVPGGGGDVGPNLSKIGLERPRDYLLESLVTPNAKIAKGYETAVLAMIDGKVHVGIVKSEDDQKLTVMPPTGVPITVEKADIDERATGKSGMPEDIVQKLTLSELRDLIEYLATLDGRDAIRHGQ